MPLSIERIHAFEVTAEAGRGSQTVTARAQLKRKTLGRMAPRSGHFGRGGTLDLLQRYGAQEVEFAEIDAAMAKDGVSGREVKVEIRKCEMIEIVGP